MSTNEYKNEPAVPQEPIKDHVIRETVNQLRDCAVKFHATHQLRERIAGIVVPLLKSTHAAPSQPVTCGNGCSCLVQCGDTYAHAGLPSPKDPVTLTDDLRQQLDVALGQVRYLLKDQAEKAAIIAALREKQAKATP